MTSPPGTPLARQSRRSDRVLRGILFLCGALFFFVVMNSMVKILTNHYPVAEVVWARYAAQFLLMGAKTVQVCTGAMLRGYEVVAELKDELSAFMADHGFNRLTDFIGKALPHFSTHADLNERQQAAKVARAGQRNRDNDWQGEIAKETDALTATK